jgi:ribosomal protein S18 acetylase RimI-like enzyme
MDAALQVEGWSLEHASERDVDELMSWFNDQHSTGIWGGPNFRYPFDRESFVEDCRWHEISTFCLRNPENAFSAFGQIYERNKRMNLARLVAHPEMRGQGVGKRLVQMLMTAGAELLHLDEYSLYVYRDNAPALKCYLSLGFEIQGSPPDEALADVCYYMTRTVER